LVSSSICSGLSGRFIRVTGGVRERKGILKSMLIFSVAWFSIIEGGPKIACASPLQAASHQLDTEMEKQKI
jgi:hypothetical protein